MAIRRVPATPAASIYATQARVEDDLPDFRNEYRTDAPQEAGQDLHCVTLTSANVGEGGEFCRVSDGGYPEPHEARRVAHDC